MAGYRLRTLGGLALLRDGQPVGARSPHRKALTLLAVLAAGSPAGMPRERLMVLFWPESDVDHARGSLKQMLHALRRQLDDPDVFDGVADVGLDGMRLPSDVGELHGAIQAGDDAQIVQRYAGPFLDGVHVDGAHDLERLIDSLRARFARQHLAAMERLAEAARARGDAREAERLWWRLQMLDPMNGRFVLGLIKAMDAAGDRPGALRQARSHAARLRDELSLDPDDALTAYVDQLCAGAPMPARGPLLPGGSASDAYELVESGLRAQRFVSPGSPAASLHLAEAQSWFTRALSIDPRNARGLCGMGNCRYLAGMIGVMPRDAVFAEGRRLIFDALSADDRCAEVHCSLGKIALYIEDDFPASARYLQRALDLDPLHAEALRIQSVVFKILGRADDAVRAAREASRRCPDVPSSWNTLGDALLAAGYLDEALEALQRTISLRAGYVPALERLEVTRRRRGEHRLALDVRRSRLGMTGEKSRAIRLARNGDKLGADEAIRADIRSELTQLLHEADCADPFEHHYLARTVADRIVTAHAELGEWSNAMDWVEAAYERRPGRLRRLLGDSLFDRRGLRADPRYDTLMRVAGTADMR